LNPLKFKTRGSNGTAARRKAEIKADLTLLESRRVAAVSQTEARILEEDESQTGAASQDQRSQPPEGEADPLQRVQNYVEEQSLSLTNQDAIANHDNTNFYVHMDNIIGGNTRVINPHPMVTNTPVSSICATGSHINSSFD
jgi:hypothetical protein